jgi:hypothetical protein
MKSEIQMMNLDRAKYDAYTWIIKADSLRIRLKSLGVIISGEDMILHTLNNIANKYASTIEI